MSKISKTRANEGHYSKRFLNITLEFCERSTVHGLNHVAFSMSVRHRYFWLSICLCANIGMLINVYFLLEKFIERPVLTNMYQNHLPFEYPDLSFCFTNPIYFPPMNSSDIDFLLEMQLKYIEFKNMHQNFLADQIKFADYLYMTRNIGYVHPQWSAIVDCRYLGQACTSRDLTVRHLYSYGSCFTFNYSRFGAQPRQLSHFHSTELNLIIYKAVDITISNFGDPFENVLMPSGILLMIHDKDSWPYIQESFILNYYTQINLKVTNIHHANVNGRCRPIRNQFTYRDVFIHKDFAVYGKYTDCIFQNVQILVAKYCDCQWQPMQVLHQFADLPFCIDGSISFTKIFECLNRVFVDLNDGSLDYCYLDDCQHTKYETVISQSHFPAVSERKTYKQWMKHLAELERREIATYGSSDLKWRCLNLSRIQIEKLQFDSISDIYRKKRFDLVDLDFVERNFMMLKIVPSSFFMDAVEEIDEYPLSRLFSDIGGSIGLWIGASLITVFEVFDLIYDMAESYSITQQRLHYMRAKSPITDC